MSAVLHWAPTVGEVAPRALEAPLRAVAPSARPDVAEAAAAFAAALVRAAPTATHVAQRTHDVPVPVQGARDDRKFSNPTSKPTSPSRFSRSPAAKRRRLRRKAPPPAALSPSDSASPLPSLPEPPLQPSASPLNKWSTSKRKMVHAPSLGSLLSSSELAELNRVASTVAGAAFSRLDQGLRLANEEYAARLNGVCQGASEVLALASSYRNACTDSGDALDAVLVAIEEGLVTAGLVLFQGPQRPVLHAISEATTAGQPHHAACSDAVPAQSVGPSSCPGHGWQFLGRAGPVVATMTRRRRQIDGVVQQERQAHA